MNPAHYTIPFFTRTPEEFTRDEQVRPGDASTRMAAATLGYIVKKDKGGPDVIDLENEPRTPKTYKKRRKIFFIR